MELHLLENRRIGGYTTFGSVWNRGEMPADMVWGLKNEKNEEIPVQSRITAWWPDGTVKWAAHTADSEKIGKRAFLGKQPEGPRTDSEKLQVSISDDRYTVSGAEVVMTIPRAGEKGCSAVLVSDVKLQGKSVMSGIYPVMILEQRREEETSGRFAASKTLQEQLCVSIIDTVDLEEIGPLQCVFRYKGRYAGQCDGANTVEMPFIIRMYINADSRELRFVHTFFYHGKEERDYLKGMGICFETILEGKPYDRHIKFLTEGKCFHEAAILLNSSSPRLPLEVWQRQMDGVWQDYSEESDVEEACRELPVWNRYFLCQDSAYHYRIGKQIKPQCCQLDCMHGRRNPGAMAAWGRNGGLMIGMQDFWQKYPSGLEADGLVEERTRCMAWFYSPEVNAYDFRHYSTESYPKTLYEGFSEVGASADGIAVTSICSAVLLSNFVSDQEMESFADRIQKPPVYVAAPEYYHSKKAFGYWSLSMESTETEQIVERQLAKALEFYREEVEERNWYGLFDYGDFMHTYDSVRHCWRYDCGGFAWQNTELVPTYWLWMYFLRTGREDAYTLASAMSRHCSEVDCYHFGPMKGIGSRHNVRHWGCSCKEPRISMAGHHRFYYYLTGDHRMGEAMEEVKDADESIINLKYYHRKNAEGSRREEYFVRNGPDWSSFVSNWMTHYERTLEPKYLTKMRNGVQDIKNAPAGLASGPEYGYDVQTGHLIYQGDREDAINTHLAVCMGEPEVWLEAAEMLEDEGFRRCLENFGRFYMMSPEEKNIASGGLIHNRSYNFRYFAADLAAFSAARLQDDKLAAEVWKSLFQALFCDKDMDSSGFVPVPYMQRNGKTWKEIPWIKTNFVSQWCLNVIVALEFIREKLPKSLEGIREMLRENILEDSFHRS